MNTHLKAHEFTNIFRNSGAPLAPKKFHYWWICWDFREFFSLIICLRKLLIFQIALTFNYAVAFSTICYLPTRLLIS